VLNRPVATFHRRTDGARRNSRPYEPKRLDFPDMYVTVKNRKPWGTMVNRRVNTKAANG